MKKFCWFAVRHKWIAWLLTGLPITAVYVLLLGRMGAGLPILIAMAIALMACAYAYITVSCPNYLLTAAVKQLNEVCDPDPLLQVTGCMLTHIRKGYMHQILLIDKAAALEELGEVQKSLDILLGIRIDRYASTQPFAKFIYYHNLYSLYEMLGETEKAEVFGEMSKQIYADLKNAKFRQQNAYVLQLTEASMLCRKDNCRRALAILASVKPPHRYADVHRAMLHAKVCLAMGNTEIAKIHLQYVVRYGNKLHAVTEAKNALERL